MCVRVYPEYYEMIKTPMDLGSLKDSVASCEYLEDFIAKARLIWDNCRAFNDPNSDIIEFAQSLALQFKESLTVL